MRRIDIEPVALGDDRAEEALRDLLDGARRTDEQLSYGAFALNQTQREQLRALLADVRRHGERAIDATARPRIARLRGRRGWRFGRDHAGTIQTPWGEQLSRRWHGAVLELCVAALKVPEIRLALLAGELTIARQTLHERLTRMQRDGPLDGVARWHELTQADPSARSGRGRSHV